MKAGYGLLPACFNPRPREGGDFIRTAPPGMLLGFQSTPPRRRRHASPVSGYSGD